MYTLLDMNWSTKSSWGFTEKIKIWYFYCLSDTAMLDYVTSVYTAEFFLPYYSLQSGVRVIH